jgi:hypothetical protein
VRHTGCRLFRDARARLTFSRMSAAGGIDPKLFPTITPLTAGFRKNVSQVEQIATIISLLGCIAVFLAVVGLLGLVSYAVAQRTREIAIRLALGANRAEVFPRCCGDSPGPSCSDWLPVWP